MYILYFSIYLVVFIYFSFLRKKIDVNSLFFAGVTIYYFPMLFNKLPEMNSRGFLTDNFIAIHDDFRMSLILFLFIFFISTLAYDLFFCKRKIFNRSMRLSCEQSIFKVLLSFTLFLFVAILISIKFNLSLSKTEIQMYSGAYMTLYIYTFSLYVLFSLYNAHVLGHKFNLLFVILVVFTLIFFKQRSLVILPILGFVFYCKWNKSLSRSDIKPFAIIFIFLVLMLLSKLIGNYFLTGDVYDYNQMYQLFVDAFEPFIINSTVNEIFISKFHLDSNYLLYAPAFLIPGGNTLLDISSQHFFHQYQPVVFPLVSFGLAYNPIAEAFSTLGYLGVIFLSVSVSIMTWIVNLSLLNTKGYMQVFIAFISIYLFFYLHRNSLFTEIVYIRNFISIFSFAIIVSFFLKPKKYHC
ncbi:O-antigen polymerase [Vibrio cyclitrophicus]